jgi:sugar lactone lactonase YvrE
MIRKTLCLFLGSLLLVPTLAQEATPEPMMPTEITFEVPAELQGLQPEGIEYDPASGRFLFGSLSYGTIHSLKVDEAGEVTLDVFTEDEAFEATVGLEVDKTNNRLLVANSGADAFMAGKGGAMLGAYDLETGEQIYMVNLGALYESKTHFANDVTVDAEGNAYVTDSFAPVIYKVTPEGEASVLVEDEQLSAPFIGGNGIVAHPDGYLLVAVGGSQSVYKVTLGDEVAVTPVELSLAFGADGIILAEDGTLYAVANIGRYDQNIVAAKSEDDWATATVTDLGETGGSATTITLVDGVPYYVNAYLGNTTRLEYELVPVDMTMGM